MGVILAVVLLSYVAELLFIDNSVVKAVRRLRALHPERQKIMDDIASRWDSPELKKLAEEHRTSWKT